MSISNFVPRHVIALQPETGFARPSELPEMVHLDSPALDVMTDFTVVRPVTVGPDVSIDRALEGMKKAGVRLLLVVDASRHVVGVVTANDLQGDKPIRLMGEERLERSQLTVEKLMTPQSELGVLDMRSVVDSQVGHIIATLDQLERQHVLVVDVEADDERQHVRGLFSSSQIAKQLGRPVDVELHAAHSLAEMVWHVD